MYLTDKIDRALAYAYDASKNAPPEDLDYYPASPSNACIIRVKCLVKGAKLGPDGYGDLMTNKSVPPECVEVLYPDDLRMAFPEEWSEQFFDEEEAERNYGRRKLV